MNIFTCPPIFFIYLTFTSDLEVDEAYSVQSTRQANRLTDIDSIFDGLSYLVA